METSHVFTPEAIPRPVNLRGAQRRATELGMPGCARCLGGEYALLLPRWPVSDDGQQHAHARHQCHLPWLSGCCQPRGELPNHGVVDAGAERCHVEHFSQAGASRPRYAVCLCRRRCRGSRAPRPPAWEAGDGSGCSFLCRAASRSTRETGPRPGSSLSKFSCSLRSGLSAMALASSWSISATPPSHKNLVYIGL